MAGLVWKKLYKQIPFVVWFKYNKQKLVEVYAWKNFH